MRKYFIVAGLHLVALLNVYCQSGVLKESLHMESKTLKRAVNYSIYLPYDYNSSDRQYPVLYLLHGYTDNETAWSQFGEVKAIADAGIGNPLMTPMIIVMPDAGLDWYVNASDGSNDYEDFFIQEFIPFIEDTYKVRGEKQYRGIAGLSMGGHGTFLYALKYSELFAAAAPLSAAVFDEDWVLEQSQEDWDQYFWFLGKGLAGEDRLTDHLKSSMPYYLVKSQEIEKLNTVKWYIDCGDDDFLIEGNMEMHKIMRARKIDHEFRVRDGEHNWTYWREALPTVLELMSETFHR